MKFVNRLRIAVAGYGSDVKEKNKKAEVIKLVQQIQDYASQDTLCDLYTSPYFSDDIWLQLMQNKNFSLNCVVPNSSVKSTLLDNASSVTTLETLDNSIVTFNSINDWIINKSDILIIIWDGTETSHNGMLHAICQRALDNEIPCVRINPSDGRKYFLNSLSSVELQEEDIIDYLKKISSPDTKKLFEQNENKEFLFSKLWSFFYKKFQKKYKRNLKLLKDPEDPILKENYFDKEENTSRKRNYKFLLDLYNFFDTKSNTISGQYREAIYFRSILPFIATIFLAVGFYVETLGKFLIPQKWELFGNKLAHVLAIIAGVGFLIHALINLYGFVMSKNKGVTNKLHVFINSRYCAEYLRNALYFMSFGLAFRQQKRFTPDSVQLDQNTVIQLNKIIRSLEPTSSDFTQENCNEILKNMIQMVDDQYIYHKNTEQRYLKITKKLESASNVFFGIGFGFVILRGLFQCFVPSMEKGLSINLNNGKTLKDFLQSFANMLALILPSWASFFSTKLSLNNFKNLADHSSQTASHLSELKKALEQTQQKEHITYEMVHSLSENILELQLSELSGWYSLTATKNITKL